MYHNKYIKYKTKNFYLNNNDLCIEQYGGDLRTEQYGGADDNNIVDFIKKSSTNTIKTGLLNLLRNDKYCKKILGEGIMGSVYLTQISNTGTIVVGNKSITVPVVVKSAKNSDEIYFNVIKNILYIYAYRNITMEAIILSYTNDLWYKKKTPHLPLMIGYSACNSKYVNIILTERHGLDTAIKIEKDKINTQDLFHPKAVKNNTSFINTLASLLKYIFSQRKENITLPNGIKCNFAELFDYICISYIHTHNLLQENNIYLTDMHGENIFIHWLGENSYMGNKYIGDTKKITYKIKNKMFQIKTFGFIIKVGDVGSSIVRPKKNVIILGQGNNLEKNYVLLDFMLKKNFLVNNFIFSNKCRIPLYLFEQTVIYKIMNTYPYNNTSWMNGLNEAQTSLLLTPEKLLDFYSEYQVDKIDAKSLVVEEK